MPCRALLVLVAALAAAIAATAGAAMAQEAAAADAGAPPAKVAELLRLVDDPAVRRWLAQAQRPPDMLGDAAAIAPAAEANLQEAMAGRLDRARTFVGGLAGAAARLPVELSNAFANLAGELRQRGTVGPLALIAVFAALGFGCEWLFWRATAGFRHRMIAVGLDGVGDRLRAVGLRTVYGLGVLLAFALGSVGAFLAFDWPPLLRAVVLSYLSVFLIVRLVLIFGRILLAPGAERFRVVPMATATARFWFLWSAVLVGYFVAVRFTLDLLLQLGVARDAVYALGVGSGVILLGLTLRTIWRHPDLATGAPPEDGRQLGRLLVSLYVVAVYLLLFTGSVTPFYVGVVLLLLPIAIRCTQLAVDQLLRPAGDEPGPGGAPSLLAVALQRGGRAALLIGGAYLIADIVELDLGALSARETPAMRLGRGLINAAIVLLLADFAWHCARAWIDGKIARAGAEAAGHAVSDEARRRARVRTLLPILRNILFIVLLVTAALMALAGLGVQIGPLLAGAGVVGVAVGFGAQTLVKDIIAGMFFLLDDAFRIGEYIESGSIRGTVESFSLRSVKLRHHRGYLHTVPFGSLEKITNYSRDWVIDKITLGVSYDTDLDRVKRLTKQIGKELLADPDMAPHILETLKMQGVEEYGEYAIKLRFKMMTRPGEQFVIRRRAYAMIKKAFAANDIQFAFPTVQVAGGDAATGAAAQTALNATAPKPAAA